MKFRIIATGSRGNAVLYDHCLVDVGVPYASLEPFMKDVKIIFLTHIHNDHFNLRTLKRISKLHPTIPIVCCDWLSKTLGEIKHHVLEIGKVYDFGYVKASPVKLYHDVPNCGWRLFIGNEKIFHATDTAHLRGISASGYDIYGIEHNYDENEVDDIIELKRQNHQFAHEIGAKESHLSIQQAEEFIFLNAKGKYEVLKLHGH